MQNSPSLEAGVKGQTVKRQSYRYVGKSMLPTFQPGQVLYVRPEVRKVGPGDIIVYRFEEKYVVHRVESVQAEGYRTRGDNNSFFDSDLVRPEQVVGIVDEVDAGQEIRFVSGGHLGLRVVQFRRGIRKIFFSALKYLGFPYRWLRQSHLVGRIWHPQITKIYLFSDGIPLVKYVYHGKAVACWSPGAGQFSCRKPFDLVLFSPE